MTVALDTLLEHVRIFRRILQDRGQKATNTEIMVLMAGMVLHLTGVEPFTIARLGRELGMQPASLYRVIYRLHEAGFLKMSDPKAICINRRVVKEWQHSLKV